MDYRNESDTSATEARVTGKSVFRSAARLYMALAIAALVGTLGWFTTNTLVFIENETPGNIQISVNSGDLWIAQQLAEFDDTTYMTAMKKAQLLTITREESTYIDVTGDGAHLYYPKNITTNESNQDTVDMSSASNFADVTGNTDFYIELRVYFRTTSQMEVYLSKDSKIEGKEKSLVNKDKADSFSRTSLFGHFNCDGIIGAARVAFLESNMAEGDDEVLTLKNVWIPNDDIMLSYSDVGLTQADLEVLDASSADRESKRSGYGYLAPSGTVMGSYSYTPADYANGNVTVTTSLNGETVLANPNTNMSNQATPLLSFTEEGTIQTKLMVIRIWFEGTDNEADKALNGGMATYNLSFLGIGKDDPTYKLATQDAVTNKMIPSGQVGIYYNTTKACLCYYEADNYDMSGATPVDNTSYLLYSLDGIEWSNYTSTSYTVLNAKRSATADYTLYIRLAEGKDTKPGNVVAITVPATGSRAPGYTPPTQE